MDEKKPIKDLKDILAQVESAAPAKAVPFSAQINEEKIDFVERAKIENIFHQIQASPSETIAPPEMFSLLMEADGHTAQTPNSKILADLIKQKKI